MSYCDGNWFSDYNYRRMQVYLTPADRTQTADADRVFASSAAVDQELLLVSGEIRNGVLRLNPLKASVGRARTPTGARTCCASPPAAAPWSSSASTAARSTTCRELQRFGFTIAHPGAIDRVEVLHEGRVLAQRAAREQALSAGAAASTVPATVQANEQGGCLPCAGMRRSIPTSRSRMSATPAP